ncbi:MAG: dethiobiotin synthase [Schwartzia sp.]|nr:dethiobiotin synthase [Schwartzia sp. (in: firmicutes)]
MGKALFITGTGTDVGKTYVTALIVKCLRDAGLDAGYYKAAISGAEKDEEDGTLHAGDALYVKEIAELSETQEELVSYVYEAAVSPHLAAQLDNKPIDFDVVEKDFRRALSQHEYITMEGSGGIICPLRWDKEQHVILDDLVLRLGLGALIVADAGLGTINAAVLTVEHLRARNISVRGIILNRFHEGDVMEEDNLDMVEALTGVKVVATVKSGDEALDMDAKELAALYQ